MIVLWCRVGLEPELIKIDGSLKSMQKLVGGLIEPVYCLEENAVLLCNEEGLVLSMPFNRFVNEQPIFGDFFICGLGEESFIDLPKNFLYKQYMNLGYDSPIISIVVNQNVEFEESLEYLL